jgi:Tol biopolymer transport system component
MKWALLFISTLLFKYSFSQQGSEILLFDISVVNGQVTLANGINITNHKGYDNQPFFHPSKPIVYYASFNDSGRSDIKYYNFLTATSANLTNTDVREYSPTVTPDANFISCIIQRDNGAQDLGKYPVNGGNPEILINDLIVGYHAWIDAGNLMLFVLGDSNNHSLRHYDLEQKKNRVIATNIGRSLHKIPGRSTMSFVQNKGDSTSVITEFDPSTGKIKELITTIKGSDHLCWLNNGILLMSNRTGIYFASLGEKNSWKPVIMTGYDTPLPGATRISTDSTNTKLAIVVAE